MKTSSANDTPKAVDKPTAWACTLANLATVPGLGSIAAGRKVGFVQAALALVALAASLVGTVQCYRLWLGAEQWPPEDGFPPGFWASLFTALGGVMLYAGAWLWALRSSLSLHREARQAAAAYPRHEPSPTPPRPPQL
ncbi:MAG: hypothetical protein FJ387_08495 [Verrucomicrobia bacterium]|nr:hypothetical protein [Verrucomicrobiota bacterium]